MGLSAAVKLQYCGPDRDHISITQSPRCGDRCPVHLGHAPPLRVRDEKALGPSADRKRGSADEPPFELDVSRVALATQRGPLRQRNTLVLNASREDLYAPFHGLGLHQDGLLGQRDASLLPPCTGSLLSTHEDECMFAHQNLISISEYRLRDLLPIHKSAVATLKILDKILAVHGENFDVIARNGEIVYHDVIPWLSAY